MTPNKKQVPASSASSKSGAPLRTRGRVYPFNPRVNDPATINSADFRKFLLAAVKALDVQFPGDDNESTRYRMCVALHQATRKSPKLRQFAMVSNMVFEEQAGE